MAHRYPRRSFLSFFSQWGAKSQKSKGPQSRDQRRGRSPSPTSQSRSSSRRPVSPNRSQPGQIPPIHIPETAYLDPVLDQLRQKPPITRNRKQTPQLPPPNSKKRRRGKPTPRQGVSSRKPSNIVPLNRSITPQPYPNLQPTMQPLTPVKKRVVRRTRRRVSPIVYGTRLLILGIGIGVISGTVLSILNSLGRATADASSIENLETQETRINSPISTRILPLSLQLNREIKDLKNQLESVAATSPDVSPALMFLDLNTGGYVGLREQSIVPAASTIKVPILVAFFQAVDAGEIRLDEMLVMTENHQVGEAGIMQYQPPGTEYTALETATKMMTISDNTATNMIIDRLGGFQVLNQRFRSWGLTDTMARNPLPDIEGTNKTTPRDMVNLFSQIHQGGLLSMTSRDRLLRIMTETENNHLLPSGVGNGAVVAHKTGTLNIMLADVGIVDMPNGKRYILAILAERTNGNQAAESMIQKMSRQVYEYMLAKTSETVTPELPEN
ncbi:serine hydrolase [Arthrospira platensis]|uniref:Beta-lactamase n=1 Tax=Limnospira platensis NIES-46 TaxID=1236695 RepID=A0A5M3TBE6_LIMPL|nr:serine hydrolase [Arthrospira platensis]AMW27165.1 serine hydrolase [Arthrospira platensis YZ]KDR55446.1 beta-lactamase [Arthrospira platensis str. Paraca]MBD2572230.1 serine hydrolase [Arthrospira platensis FACHB-971]MBD2668564.1 serine hydrolase [Arthrospira platensis FACHB-439]MBD2709245.1 serine hydrolase [Arthrospira platensis FACHB-835]MDF2211347.1 class A beta-lactamase-related serine hydrolase [Arthrospira platensis NCB002]MDT9181703.1 class A beta-lactamase-related serine hydrola